MIETNLTDSTEKTSRFNLEKGLRSRAFRAKELGLCEATLARAMKRGELGFCRVGDRVLMSDVHVEQWLAALERPARTPKRAA